MAVVDIAGTAWPVFKLEAVALGSIVFLLALLLGSMQVAVLAGATVCAAFWVAGTLRSDRQARGAQ
ncbi:hypothetical protein [Antrihabitans sp. YC2-6]|uniref:hypothetical protein n=1 Tax=Antrihabitans sp. YC2-6 TaxID=2799498 RepID=UPI0018F3D519|nr:hypothetical protein [Antrihabitans sp. YC2-6]MBJ8343182.1 hypothetical protein [Antrihabitans sp. YC2-6]